jgi:hypothetical protein
MVDGELVVTFGDGSCVVVNREAMPAAICEQAMWHGFKQKLIDAAAIPRNTETGRSATLAEKIAAVREVFDRLLAGEWNKVREGGGGTSDQALLVDALCRLQPNAVRGDVMAKVKAMTVEERNALMVHKKVANIIDVIRAERAKGADGDAILAGLIGG